MPEDQFDVVVLGGGAGGFPAAVRAAQLGGRVAIIEERHFGGLCMNRGCIPFSNMAAASNILGSLSLGKELGLKISKPSLDYASFQERQNNLIGFMREGVKGMLKKNRVAVINGKGELDGKGKVNANGKTILYRNLILATGAKWTKPDFPGSDVKGVINSDGLLNSESLPERILLFGTSPWLVEIAQFLNNFGSKVILATDAKSILNSESKPVRSRLEKALKKDGVKINKKTKVIDIKRKKDTLHVAVEKKGKQEKIVVDRVLVLNRRANLKGMGLSSVGLNEDDEFIKTDNRMRTTVDNIYAIGDVASSEDQHFSHSASTTGIIAAENALGLQRKFDSRVISRVLFTRPQMACVGLTGKEAKKKGYEVVVGTAPLSMNPYGMILSQTEGIVEVVSERKYGEILGIHIVGEGASEMAGQGIMAIQMEMTLEELARMTYPHPTLSESITEAAREALGQQIYIP